MLDKLANSDLDEKKSNCAFNEEYQSYMKQPPKFEIEVKLEDHFPKKIHDGRKSESKSPSKASTDRKLKEIMDYIGSPVLTMIYNT